MEEPLSPDQVFIRKLTDLVLGNLKNENFSVKELARELNMSHYGLSRKLYLIKGKKVSQFIREVRLKKALELLQNEDITASEVAYNLGFSSPSYFSKCFHEYFGFPPGKVVRTKSVAPDEKSLENNFPESRSAEGKIIRTLLTSPGILLTLVVLFTIGFLVFKKLKTEPDLTDNKITIAVLPFQNRSNDTLLNFWEEGIQESLISWLSNSKELKVTRKETIYTLFKTQRASDYASVTPALMTKLSNKLDANLFIYGSIIEAGTRVMLNAELISSKTKDVLKTFEITTPEKGKIDFEIIDSLRKRITDFLLVSKLITENPWLKNIQSVSTNSPEALKYYIYGYRAYYKGDWATARNWFLKALSADSNYVDAMSRVYSASKNLGKMEEALPWLIKLYKKADQMPYLNQLYTKWLYAELFEAPEVRIKYLRQLQEIDDQGNYYYLIGAMYVRDKQFEKAIPEYKKYLEISRKRGKEYLKDNWVYPALGEVYHTLGQYKKERRLYREAERINDDHMSVFFSWVINDEVALAITEGDTLEANRLINKLISILKDNSFSEAEITQDLAWQYWRGGNQDQAEEYFRKALRLEPLNPDRMNTLANRLIDRNKNYDEVTELIDKALELAQTKYDYYNYLDTKGWGLHKQGRYQEALVIFQKTWDEAPFKLYTFRSHLEEVKKAVSGQI